MFAEKERGVGFKPIRRQPLDADYSIGCLAKFIGADVMANAGLEIKKAGEITAVKRLKLSFLYGPAQAFSLYL